MNEQIVVLGYGPVGQATAELLLRQGRPVRVAQRSLPTYLPEGATFTPCDVLDVESVQKAIAGAGQIVVAIGFHYDSATWHATWPRAMGILTAACKESGARMVFIDNLYMYGPQHDPLREDMPLTSYGIKPAVRAEVTHIWMAASKTAHVRVAALRAPDFYGPGVLQSHLGELAFGSLAKGKRAMLIMRPDMPHDFAYVPDIARAAVTLLDAPDDAFGQAWHVPCAPTLTPRQILALAAPVFGGKPKIFALPHWLLAVLKHFSPDMRELWEMRFLFDRPYRVDSEKFAKRFWSDATPFETGVTATADWFKRRPA